MDDYNVSTLIESKNEWCARLVNIFTPCIIKGLSSIFEEALKLCLDNDEEAKYLMTFQNFLSRVPKWNPEIIKVERERITNNSGCGYIEDLITCVHIIQLKALTCARVGLKQKKVDINIPSVDDFVHNIYINVARKVYTNIYLFEKDIMPLQIQKNNRELEVIIKECILNSVRTNIPIEEILRAYLDETEEQDVRVEEKNEIIKLDDDDDESGKDGEKGKKQDDKKDEKDTKDKSVDQQIEDIVNRDISRNVLENSNLESLENKLENNALLLTNIDENDDANNAHNANNANNRKSPISFSDTDIAITNHGIKEEINAPKTLERLNEIAELNNIKRKEEDAAQNYDEDDDGPLNIGEKLTLDLHEINDLTKKTKLDPDILLSDIEVLG